LSSVKMIPTLFNASATPRSSTMSSAGKYSKPARAFFRPHLLSPRTAAVSTVLVRTGARMSVPVQPSATAEALTAPTNRRSGRAGWPYPNNPPPPPPAAAPASSSFSTSNAARNSRGVVCVGPPPSPLVQCEGPPSLNTAAVGVKTRNVRTTWVRHTFVVSSSSSSTRCRFR
jgi:hypothetical protein